MMLTRILGGFAAGMMVAGLAGTALAAEALDLVGTWKATSHVSVQLGAASEYYPEHATPHFGTSDEAWTLEIKEQQGRAFHGVARPPKGGEVAFVGVISFDGDHLIIATERGAARFGEVLGDQIEICVLPWIEGRAVVACNLMAKE